MKPLFFVILILNTLIFAACSTSKTASIPEDNNSKQFLTLEDRLLKTPGVFIQNGEVRIRGGDQSFYGNSEPLFEVNGQVVSGGFNSVKNLFSPLDIKSIRVLKNPEDLAMYGTRGLNGVIKIRLKNEKG